MSLHGFRLFHLCVPFNTLILQRCTSTGFPFANDGILNFAFYCTEHLELAKEWASGELKDGFANEYEIDLKGLKIVNLNSPDYTIVDWLAVLVANRDVQVTTPIQIEAKKQLLKRFLPDFSKADIIRGYRADDSYFSFARAFLGNEISLRQLSLAMRLDARLR